MKFCTLVHAIAAHRKNMSHPLRLMFLKKQVSGNDNDHIESVNQPEQTYLNKVL